MYEDSVEVEVSGQRSRQDAPLQALPLLNHVLHRIPERESDLVLVDDGTGVQVSGDAVGEAGEGNFHMSSSVPAPLPLR